MSVGQDGIYHFTKIPFGNTSPHSHTHTHTHLGRPEQYSNMADVPY